ncbi:Autoinducer 2 sensor kinase/phosphatase LuxQ [Luteitalea pratensis]|uniref:histidine kinase n=1 Tax=Luteitalea pratensis TaxID=1855912 RepID=A0A143PK16_LUTPR|nr:ATP-binding protein [Luteitalea pratensis]AMY08766.1 Autoinducer 2 sensor kinase/phosphatase LuxQ [Luteitalea pratensis]
MNDARVVVWAPGRDGRLTCDVLRDRGFSCLLTRAWSDVLFALHGGTGTLLVAGELLTGDIYSSLEGFLTAQPAWSDLPIIVVGADGEDLSAPHPLQALGNVSLLPRPLVLPTLTSTVQAALRARARQYQVRDLLWQRDEAARRKDEFLAMLAHELRNPLAPLRTGLQVLRLSPSAAMAERMHHLMERQLTNVTRLVDDLLDVSRLTRGVVTLKLRPVDVRDVVHQACEAASAAARETGLTLARDVPQTPLVVMADPVRLDQMVGNLLTNAIRFTQAGGRIDVRAERTGGHVRVGVRDTGQGIAASQLPRVFDLFAQSDRPIDRGQGGLGIGLTVVRSLAELHGGAASIASEGEGRGTEARIDLPLHAETIEAAVTPAEVPHEVEGRRVVIIEDNADAAEALAVYLQRIGHDVTVARDGRSGLDAVQRHRPHAIICDIGLPELDGYEVARRLLAQGLPSQCLLIAVTGYGDVVGRARTRAAGFSHHLTKPADPAALARLIEGTDAACA